MAEARRLDHMHSPYLRHQALPKRGIQALHVLRGIQNGKAAGHSHQEPQQIRIHVQACQQHRVVALEPQFRRQRASHRGGPGASLRPDDRHHLAFDVARRTRPGLPPMPHHRVRYVAHQQVARAGALHQVVFSAVADGLQGHRLAIGGTQDNHRNLGAPAVESQEGLDSMAVGKAQIEQHDVDAPPRQTAQGRAQRFGPAQRKSGIRSGSVQPLLDQSCVIGVVFDE